MADTQLTVIVNPVSGKGNEKEAQNRSRLIKKLLKEMKMKAAVHETSLKKTATLIAEKAIQKGAQHIVVCGGDGTVMEVVAACVDKKVKMGVVPLGTGNLFAQNVNIPLDIKEALHTALFGTETKIDIGKANGTYFAIMAGVGLDAAMLKDANRKLKDSLGVFAYVLSLFKNIFKPSNVYELKVDNKQPFKVRAKSIIVGNMAEISAGIKVIPNAHPQTGTLKIGVLKTHSIISWIELLFTAVKSSVKDSDHYMLLEGSHIEIKSLRGKRIYECDGNLFPATDILEVDIYPHSLKIVVPSKGI